MTALEMILQIYRGLIAKCEGGVIPVKLRAKRLVGTVQDDPFDWWMQDEIKEALPILFITILMMNLPNAATLRAG